MHFSFVNFKNLSLVFLYFFLLVSHLFSINLGFFFFNELLLNSYVEIRLRDI